MLSKFNVQVNLGIGGISSEASLDKMVPGILQQCQNADISTPGRIRKRRGLSVNLPNDQSSTNYDRVFSVFSSPNNCYRVVDNLCTDGTIYDGSWLVAAAHQKRRLEYGHRVIQRLTNPTGQSNVPYWRTIGPVATPITQNIIEVNAVSANVLDAGNINNDPSSSNPQHGASAVISYQGQTIVGLAMQHQVNAAAPTAMTINFVVRDYVTGSTIAKSGIFLSNSAAPSVVGSADGRYLFFTYTPLTDQTVWCVTFDASTKTFTTTSTHLITVGSAGYSIAVTAGSLLVSYNDGVNFGIKKFTYAKASGASGATPAADFSAAFAAVGTDHCINGYVDYPTGENCCLFWLESAGGPNYNLRGKFYDGTLTPVGATTTIYSPGAPLSKITAKPYAIPYDTNAGGKIANSKGQSMILTELTAGTNTNIVYATFGESSGTIYTQLAVTSTGLKLATQIFGFGGSLYGPNTSLKNYTGGLDDNYVFVYRASPSGIEDPDLYLLQINPPYSGTVGYTERCAAKITRTVGATNIANVYPTYASIGVVNDDFQSAIVPICSKDVNLQFYVIANNAPDFGEIVIDGTKELLNGGYFHSLGVDSCFEREPLMVPAIPSLSQGGGGSLPLTSTFLVCCVVRINYDNGIVARSAPSVPATITTTGVNNSISASCQVGWSLSNVPNLNNSMLIVEWYRTTAGGTTFYLDSTNANQFPIYVDNTHNTHVFTQTDAALQTCPILYTTGGVIENITSPNSGAIAVYKGRRIAAVGQSESVIWMTKLQNNSSLGQFSDLLKYPVPMRGVDVVAIKELDDKAIIFTQGELYYFAGEGPNDTGSSGAYSLPSKIEENSGLTSVKAIARVDNELIFRGVEGFYKMTSNLQVVKISDPTTFFSRMGVYNITSCVNLSSHRKMAFYTDTGYRLTFYPDTETWSAENIGVSLAAKWSDFTVVLKKQGTTYQNLEMSMETQAFTESATTYTDSVGGYYSLGIKTGWIPFTGIQGFARAWRVALLGRIYSNCTLNVGFSYNYNPAITDTVQLTLDTSTAQVISDDDLYVNLQNALSSTIPILQRRIHMPRQKVEAVQLTIWDTNQSGTGQSYELNQITFECGLRQGVMKLPAAQSNV